MGKKKSKNNAAATNNKSDSNNNKDSKAAVEEKKPETESEPVVQKSDQVNDSDSKADIKVDTDAAVASNSNASSSDQQVGTPTESKPRIVKNIRVTIRPPKPHLEGLPKKKAFKLKRTAVLYFAKYLGMDLDVDQNLLFIAEEALFAPVPEPWIEKFDMNGISYYYNPVERKTSFQHPLDVHYRKMYLSVAKKRPLEERNYIEDKRKAVVEAAKMQEQQRKASIPKQPSKFEILMRRTGIITLLLLCVLGAGYLAYSLCMFAFEFDRRGPWIFQALGYFGSVDAQLYTGTTYLEGAYGVPVDGALAVMWFERANETGHPAAVRMLGLCYYKGIGKELDYVEAARLFVQASNRGDIPSKAFAGYMFYKGQGLPVDYTQAVTWTREAADKGDGNAAYNLAMIFHEGHAVTKNYGQAYAWYLIAAQHEELHDKAKAQIEFLKPRLRAGEEDAATNYANSFSPQT